MNEDLSLITQHSWVEIGLYFSSSHTSPYLLYMIRDILQCIFKCSENRCHDYALHDSISFAFFSFKRRPAGSIVGCSHDAHYCSGSANGYLLSDSFLHLLLSHLFLDHETVKIGSVSHTLDRTVAEPCYKTTEKASAVKNKNNITK